MKSSLRGFSKYVTGAAFVTLALLVPNCQPSGGDYGAGEGGSGGSGVGGSGSGGSTSKGGSGGDSSGGNGSGGNGSGGHVGTGGSQGSGGTSTTPKGTGGSGAGGVSTTPKGTGGSGSGSGGAQGTGGTTATTTVVTGTGGTTTTTTSTSTSVGNTGTTVVFGAGKGQGAMTGYGYVALGSADSISSPTCGTAPITSAAPCAAGTTWSATDKLCVTGAVPVLDKTTPDYTGNWGLSVGLNSSDPEGKGLGQAFTSVTITTTGVPSSGLRAIVHLVGESKDTQYCSPLTSGTAIPFTSFSATCWDTAKPGTAVTAAQATTVDKIAVQVTSNQTAAITVTELCITKIEFK